MARDDIASALTLMLDPPARGDVNMARDLALLDECVRGEIAGAVRLYSFRVPQSPQLAERRLCGANATRASPRNAASLASSRGSRPNVCVVPLSLKNSLGATPRAPCAESASELTTARTSGGTNGSTRARSPPRTPAPRALASGRKMGVERLSD